jgi:protein-S-isoprenylcysteine O-methyltransferase Ste14
LVREVLQTLAWLACAVYATIPLFWLMIHPCVGYWRSRSGSPYRVLLPLWIAMWIILGLITAPWRQVSVYRTSWSWVPSVALFATGFWIYKTSGKQFNRTQLSGRAELLPRQNEQQLVTSGIRGRVRHPVYLGHLCEMLAWSIGTGLAVCYILTAFAVVTGAIMIRLEDKELEQRFGAEYIQYRQRVPAVIPSLRI